MVVLSAHGLCHLALGGLFDLSGDHGRGREVTQQPLLDVDPSVRRAFDYYPTPAWMTKALLRRVRPFDVIEPCAGRLAIVDVLKAHLDIGFVQTNDLDPSAPTETHEDATRRDYWQSMLTPRIHRPYWGVTNVPFDLADQIVPLAVEHLQCFATILRLSWLEPTAARQRFLAEHPPCTLIVMPRHDFKGRGATDSVTSAWFIWEQGWSSATRGIEIVTKDERDELIAASASETR